VIIRIGSGYVRIIDSSVLSEGSALGYDFIYGWTGTFLLQNLEVNLNFTSTLASIICLYQYLTAIISNCVFSSMTSTTHAALIVYHMDVAHAVEMTIANSSFIDLVVWSVCRSAACFFFFFVKTEDLCCQLNEKFFFVNV
jgi:hypothetical protein